MFRLLIFNNLPILEQLRLEEALLRCTSENWCLLNTGSPEAIVMGISGKPEKLLNMTKVAENRIPVIKRFSGGGTVYIDPQTVFVTWICNGSTLNIPLHSRAILEWSETFYRPLFKDFLLKENDYAIGERKCGGNALYLQKGRWLLHTSLLWNYDQAKMECLLIPEKCPTYRRGRSHSEFLCTLNTHYPSKEQLIKALEEHVKRSFQTELLSHEHLHPFPPTAWPPPHSNINMATKKEIDEHLKIALDEVGAIKPWFDKEIRARWG